MYLEQHSWVCLKLYLSRSQTADSKFQSSGHQKEMFEQIKSFRLLLIYTIYHKLENRKSSEWKLGVDGIIIINDFSD